MAWGPAEERREELKEAMDLGYRKAVTDIIGWHTNEILKLNEAIQKSFVDIAAGRPVEIGVVWEGQYTSSRDLVPIVHFHKECLKHIEKTFLK